MKLRNPRLIRVVGRLIAVFLRVWRCLVRLRIDPAAKAQHIDDPTRGRGIYIFWHESLLAMVALRMKAVVMISKHADGELIATACQGLGIGTVRGSTTRGGGLGLIEMARQSVEKAVDLAITPDGPRGPRRKLQPGVIALASHTGWPIVPVGIGFTWAWRAKSWDQFAVPLPFGRITYITAEPIRVPADLDRDALEEYRLLVERRFLAITDEAERRARELAGPSLSDPKAGPHRPRAGRKASSRV
ncbi:MAG: lysophospholipid acyltransferase family protein [Isosphaeraceae bacterium]